MFELSYDSLKFPSKIGHYFPNNLIVKRKNVSFVQCSLVTEIQVTRRFDTNSSIFFKQNY